MLSLLVDLGAVYVAVGILFAAAFAIAGVQRIDTQAEGSGIAFRLFVIPGAAALWPMLLVRWRRGVRLP